MTQRPRECSDKRLALVLLSDDESSDEVRQTVEHVDSCAECQARLGEFAADENLWNDARAFLSSEFSFDWRPMDSLRADRTSEGGGSSETTGSLQAAVTRLLATPQHPEMLGRLGRYDIERIIGSGGMGVVLKAHDSELNRPIAIKLLAAHLAHVGAARERFAREARAAAAVVHEHVVAIYNVETDGDTPFLVMQYVPGRSLQTRVEEEGPLSTEAILRIGMQAAAGLAAAHAQGLVHRDVKPSNILLEETVERAVLTDFGLARAIDDASLTQTGVLAGTPHYMSPEQATGAVIDHRSDLFSLGSVLYFMATGHSPFRAEGALAVLHRICREPHRAVWQSRKEIPDELSDVIDRLLEKKPGRRIASAEEVRTRLADLLSRAQQYGLGRRRFRKIRRPWARNRLVWVAAAALVAVAVVGGSIATWPWWQTHTVEARPAKAAAGDAVTVQTEQQLANEWRELERAVGQVDRRSWFMQTGDAWDQELDSVKRSLSQLEAADRPAAGDQGAKK
jgi:hypothetical protein